MKSTTRRSSREDLAQTWKMEPPQPQPQPAAPIRSAGRPGPPSLSAFRTAALHLAPRAAGTPRGPLHTHRRLCLGRQLRPRGSERPAPPLLGSPHTRSCAPCFGLRPPAQARARRGGASGGVYGCAATPPPQGHARLPSRRAGCCEAPPSEGAARPQRDARRAHSDPLGGWWGRWRTRPRATALSHLDAANGRAGQARALRGRAGQHQVSLSW